MEDKLYYPKEINERVKNGMGCGSQISEGWFDIVRELDTKIAKLCPDYVVDQVKEKFGGLRYYIGAVPEDVFEEVRKLIREAEAKSVETCDICGEPAKINTYEVAKYCDLTLTRCDKHVPK